MDDSLHCPNKLNNINDQIQTYMINQKIFFKIILSFIKEKLNLWLPL